MGKAIGQVSTELFGNAYTARVVLWGKSLIVGSFSAAAALWALGYSGTPLGEFSGFFAYTFLWLGVALLQYASGYQSGYRECLRRSTALKRAAELANDIVTLIGTSEKDTDDEAV